MTLAKVAKEAVLGLVKGNDAETNEAGDDDASLFVSGTGNALDFSSRLISAHLDRVIPHERVRGRGGHPSRRSNSESQCHVEKSRQVMSCTFKAETACSNSSTAQLDHHRSFLPDHRLHVSARRGHRADVAADARRSQRRPRRRAAHVALRLDAARRLRRADGQRQVLLPPLQRGARLRHRAHSRR